jgi:riboflavin kinase/FMN adenylyltransferase
VYAGRAIVQSILYPAAINLGPNPTFGESALKVEIHLLDYHDSLYGQPLEVEFLARLRDVTTFAGPEALVNQLQQDIKRTREIAAQGLAVELS